MNKHQWLRLRLALVVLSAVCLAQTRAQKDATPTQPASVTPPSVKSTGTPFADSQTSTAATVSPSAVATNGESLTSETPSPGVTDGVTPTTESMNDTFGSTGTPFEFTPSPTASIAPFVRDPEVCACDLTPDVCDIGCCCDIADCDVADLSTVFTGCPQKETKSGHCIEKWLMFRANVDTSLVTVTESLFCVRSEVDHIKVSTAPLKLPVLGNSYHFSPPQPISVGHSRHFYRADDVIQTYFGDSSVRGLLRQPSPGPVGAFCLNRNPARFLRSESLSCTRMVTPQSCSKDPNLSALSYFSDLSLIKIPKPAEEQVSDLLIAVTPLSDWPAPSEKNNLCTNVAKEVEFVIVFTNRGELESATVNVLLADVKTDQLFQQVHSVQFKLKTARPSPTPQIPSAGLRVGASVRGRFNGVVKPVSVMGMGQDGECSSDPAARIRVLFTHNTIAGCSFSSSSGNCTELRSNISSILLGDAIPDTIAMSSGSQPDWTRVLKQECPISSEETCDSGCTLPHSLSVQVLWARMGLLDLPQSYILGVKYLFRCRKLQCPLSSPVRLTTEVAFADMTVYPKPPLEFGSP
ncbi:tectonic-3-like isoform X1 [Syngnathus acus]|uniref:tectonic-3-like isoform X1 n=2 Tax=Syngnathus acus TaxID=161584 RepID=UPI001885F33B|nr:tectonic-3-like isoform X1 [Syngnathus acus]